MKIKYGQMQLFYLVMIFKITVNNSKEDKVIIENNKQEMNVENNKSELIVSNNEKETNI